MEKRIYFYGKSRDFTLAEKLYGLVSDELDVAEKVAVSEKGYYITEEFDIVAVDFSDEGKKGEKTFTYSVGQSNADICGFNFQKREKSRSLDLFSMSFMGRVNIPLDSEFTEVSVLLCAAGFVAAGSTLPQVLKAINSKIS